MQGKTMSVKSSLTSKVTIIVVAIVSAFIIPFSIAYAAYSQVANKYLGLSTNAHFYLGLNGFNAKELMGQAGTWTFGNQPASIATVGMLNVVPILFLAAVVIIALNMALAGNLDLKTVVWMAIFVFVGFVLLIVVNGGLRLIGVF